VKHLTVLFFLVTVSILAFSQSKENTKDFPNYQEMRDYFGKLYEQGKYEEAAIIMEKGLLDFPDHMEANCGYEWL